LYGLGVRIVSEPDSGGDGGNRSVVGTSREIADTGARVLARGIDLVVLGLVAGLVRAGLRLEDGVEGALGVVLLFVYDVVLVTVFGKTLGKWVVRLEVVRAEDGGRVGIGRAFVRAVGLFGVQYGLIVAGQLGQEMWTPLGILSPIGGAGWPLFLLMWVYRDEYRQGAHDRIARTVVVERALVPLG
jgi:uncharacterized RDD family membrane protein YckC